MTRDQLKKTSTPALQQRAGHLRAIILLDGGDIQARRDLLAINFELAHRRKAKELLYKPLTSRL